MIKELTRYSQKLKSKLEATDNTLDLKDNSLSDLLPDQGDYTYLTIDDGMNVEQVRAYKDAGEVMIARAQGDTIAYTFPAGACVMFEINGAFLTDFVCALECKPDAIPNECGGCSGCCD